MKLLNKIVCFFKGHQQWNYKDGIYSVMQLTHPDLKGNAHLEVCPRCHDIWAKFIPDLTLDLKIEHGHYLIDVKEKAPLRDLDHDFLVDEFNDKTLRIHVKEDHDLPLHDIEVTTRNGKKVTWTLDFPISESYSVEQQEDIQLQIGMFLNKTHNPTVLNVGNQIFNMLDFNFAKPNLTGVAQSLAKSGYGIIGTGYNGPSNAQGINAQGTVPEQSIGSFKVPGISGGNKL